MMHISTKEKGLIGNSTIDNFVLIPGQNLLPMHAIVDTSLALGSVDKQGMVNMIIVGQTAVYNGVHLPYYVRPSNPASSYPHDQMLMRFDFRKQHFRATP
jgi:hypothetical protein